MAKQTKQTAESLAGRVRALTEEVIAGTRYFVVEVSVRGHRGSRVVEVFIDSDDAVGLDDLAEVSREVEFLLDVEDVVDGKYKLEVSSPGVDRPLRLPRQFRKNVGRPLRVKYRMGSETGRAEGELTAAGGAAIEVAVAPDRTERIPYDAIEEAKVALPW